MAYLDSQGTRVLWNCILNALSTKVSTADISTATQSAIEALFDETSPEYIGTYTLEEAILQLQADMASKLEASDLTVATTSANGLMSSADKQNLDMLVAWKNSVPSLDGQGF